jgi:hypothetical protein
MIPYLLMGFSLVLPLICISLFSSKWRAYFVSLAVGCILLTARMVFLEVNAKDSDLDVIFYFAIGLWCGVLALFNAVIFICVKVLAGIFRNTGPRF